MRKSERVRGVREGEKTRNKNAGKTKPIRRVRHDSSLNEANMSPLPLSSTYTNGKPLGRDILHHITMVLWGMARI